MGISYFAVDMSHKKLINPPLSYADKSPGIFHPTNPFPGMVVMMNVRGYFFEIVNDCSFEAYEGLEDITNSVYREYLDIFNQPERLNPEDRFAADGKAICDSLNFVVTQRERSEEVAPPGNRS